MAQEVSVNLLTSTTTTKFDWTQKTIYEAFQNDSPMLQLMAESIRTTAIYDLILAAVWFVVFIMIAMLMAKIFLVYDKETKRIKLRGSINSDEYLIIFIVLFVFMFLTFLEGRKVFEPDTWRKAFDPKTELVKILLEKKK